MIPSGLAGSGFRAGPTAPPRSISSMCTLEGAHSEPPLRTDRAPLRVSFRRRCSSCTAAGSAARRACTPGLPRDSSRRVLKVWSRHRWMMSCSQPSSQLDAPLCCSTSQRTRTCQHAGCEGNMRGFWPQHYRVWSIFGDIKSPRATGFSPLKVSECTCTVNPQNSMPPCSQA